jgi:hypothetical protein
MDDRTTPNQSSNQTKAEGDRWDPNADAEGQRGQENAGGITNRPLDEEDENQAAVPPRNESREGAHAGHGDAGKSDRSER